MSVLTLGETALFRHLRVRRGRGRHLDMPKVLLIQDDTPLRDRLRRRLRVEGFQVLFASTALDGVDQARTEHPQATILDEDAPDAPAGAVCKALRKIQGLKEMPILVLCERADMSTTESLLEAGATALLHKPFTPDALARRVKGLVRPEADERPPGLQAPKPLREAFARILEETRTLGDVAEVFAGLTPRDAHTQLAEARRGPPWQPVLVETDVRSFEILYTGTHVRYDRRQLLRVPDEDLLRSLKVVVRRSAPPLVAAVDYGAMFINGGVYGVVPAKGLDRRYVAALLNSRLMDFFLRRIRPLPEHDNLATMLRTVDLQGLPVAVPEPSVQEEIASLVETVETGPHTPPAEQALEQVNDRIFRIYGLARREVRRLANLGF